MSADGTESQVSRSLESARTMMLRLEEKWNVPLSAGLEISDRCNEVCVHCYQEQGRKGEMTTEQLFGVMDELASMGVLLLTLSGGEATLRKDFLQLVRYARDKGFAVRLFTNGLTMTRELASALAELAVQNVEISLYSSRPDTHDFVTGVPGSFEKTVAGIRNLVELGVAVTVKTPALTVNAHDFGDYVRFVESLGAAHSVDVDDLTAREGGSRAPEMFQVSAATKLALKEQLHGPLETLGSAALEHAPCRAGEMILIEPNGELRPCTSLEFDLGHALQEGVAAARTSNERMIALRNLTWASLHGCRDCDVRPHCSRCYASALAQTGDALGPQPSACESALASYVALSGRAQSLARMVGPFREVAEGVLENAPDVVTAEDDALAARLGWTRRATGSIPPPSEHARPGDLVQIRRPGRKKSQLARIPSPLLERKLTEA